MFWLIKNELSFVDYISSYLGCGLLKNTNENKNIVDTCDDKNHSGNGTHDLFDFCNGIIENTDLGQGKSH